MNVISKKALIEGYEEYADAKDSLEAWYHEVSKAEWNTPSNIKERYSSASFLKNNIVIFNIRGNKYRLVVKVAYKTKIVFIKWFGTHSKYDKKKF